MTKQGMKKYKTYLNRRVRRTAPDTLAYLSDGDTDALMPADPHPSKRYRRITDADDDCVGWKRRASS